MKKNGEWLLKAASQYGISLQLPQADELVVFAELVFADACPLGLSGRKSVEEILEKDILDSLLLTVHLQKEEALLDIGSGAGFPGIPLSIALPMLHVTLLDARQKAVAFLGKAVNEELKLFRVRIEQKRAEEVNLLPVWKGCFDTAVGRAIAPMRRFIPMAAPFLKPGGKLLLQKGKKWEEELKQAEAQFKVHGLLLETIYPGLQGEQKILLIRKR